MVTRLTKETTKLTLRISPGITHCKAFSSISILDKVCVIKCYTLFMQKQWWVLCEEI